MAQYDILLTQNVHATLVEYTERAVNLAKGALLSANSSSVPTVLAGGTDGYYLKRDDAATTGLAWVTAPGGCALSGSTNNTICTVTGANAIQGEANLQFNGTDFLIAAAGKIRLDGSFSGSSYIFESASGKIDIITSSGKLYISYATITNASLGHFIPTVTDTYDFGTSSAYWKNLYIQRIYYDDTSTYIYNNAGILTFVDATTGSKTLAELAVGGSHALLSATHTDTVANAVSRGSLIYGNSTPAWSELVIGTANYHLQSDGTDIAWVQHLTFSSASYIYPVDSVGAPLFLAAYDTDSHAPTQFITLTSAPTPTCDLASSVTIGSNAIAYSGGAFHDGFSDFVSNEHINHTSVSMTTGATSGLSGGGDISSTRTLLLDLSALTAVTTLASADLFGVYISTVGQRKITYANLLTELGGDLGAGVDTFLELTDCPSSYSGKNNKLVGVDSTPDALEFKEISYNNTTHELHFPSAASTITLTDEVSTAYDLTIEGQTVISGAGGNIIINGGDGSTTDGYVKLGTATTAGVQVGLLTTANCLLYTSDASGTLAINSALTYTLSTYKLLNTGSYNGDLQIAVNNTDTSGTSARAYTVTYCTSSAYIYMITYGAANTATLYGITMGGDAAIITGTSSATYFVIGNVNAGSCELDLCVGPSAGTPTLRITYNGTYKRVAVGATSSATYSFYSYINEASVYAGGFEQDSSTGHGVYISVSTTSASYNALLVDTNSTTEAFKITGDGKIYAPQLASEAGDYYVKYEDTASEGELTYSATSDINVKENISLWNYDSLTFLENLPIKTFDMTVGHKKQGEIGWIAQDVQALYPKMVGQARKEGYLTIKEPQFLPHFHRSIQQLLERIKILEDEIELLKSP